MVFLGVMKYTRAKINPKFIAYAARADKGSVEKQIVTNDINDLIKDLEKISGLEDRIIPKARLLKISLYRA